jgi:hypothetical protein
MSNPKDVRASLGLLKNVLTTAFCACLFGIVFLSAGVAQAPGYGHGPDQWHPMEAADISTSSRRSCRPIGSLAERSPIFISN